MAQNVCAHSSTLLSMIIHQPVKCILKAFSIKYYLFCRVTCEHVPHLFNMVFTGDNFSCYPTKHITLQKMNYFYTVIEENVSHLKLSFICASQTVNQLCISYFQFAAHIALTIICTYYINSFTYYTVDQLMLQFTTLAW